MEGGGTHLAEKAAKAECAETHAEAVQKLAAGGAEISGGREVLANVHGGVVGG